MKAAGRGEEVRRAVCFACSSQAGVLATVRDGRVVDSVEVSEGVILDLDEKGRILGIEVLEYSKSGVDVDRLIKEGLEAVVKP